MTAAQEPALDGKASRQASSRPAQATRRRVDERARSALIAAGLHPILSSLLAARGIADPAAIGNRLDDLLTPDGMKGLAQAARLVADAIDGRRAICVVGDYDCDGATATAVTVIGLRRLGARADFLVPNRFTDGYGLSPGVARAAREHPRLGRTDCIITVDNGIASLAGVDTAHELGMQVVVTDHHLPGPILPAADAIVNPNQPGCNFASKSLAGVGVAFYLVAAVRAELVSRGRFGGAPPRLADLLDLVALGTVADLVALDGNNRRLVAAGLARMKTGQMRPGVAALMQVAACTDARMTVRDLGFALGPRINAAGRLEDISLGIECLMASEIGDAMVFAQRLDEMNRKRRTIEAEMRETAFDELPEPGPTQCSLVIARDDWHEGVIGLVAGKLKERWHRPTFALAPAGGEPGFLRGSGRSIPGVHLRDVLALIASREPDLIARFGGHAMAAGMSIASAMLPRFRDAFETAVHDLADPEAFVREILVDCPLTAADIDLSLARLLDAQIWGQGFAPPLFCNTFEVARQRLVGKGHLKLDLRLDGRPFNAIWFNHAQPLDARAHLAYSIQTQEFRGLVELQLIVQDQVVAI